MPSLQIAPNAKLQLAQLPREPELLRAVFRFLEYFVDHPDVLVPASFPHNPARQRGSFLVHDRSGRRYGCDALFRMTEEGEVFTVTSFAFNPDAEHYPELKLDDDPSSE